MALKLRQQDESRASSRTTLMRLKRIGDMLGASGSGSVSSAYQKAYSPFAAAAAAVAVSKGPVAPHIEEQSSVGFETADQMASSSPSGQLTHSYQFKLSM